LTATCLRDIDYYLRLVTYGMVAGDVTPIEKIASSGDREINRAPRHFPWRPWPNSVREAQKPPMELLNGAACQREEASTAGRTSTERTHSLSEYLRVGRARVNIKLPAVPLPRRTPCKTRSPTDHQSRSDRQGLYLDDSSMDALSSNFSSQRKCVGLQTSTADTIGSSESPLGKESGCWLSFNGIDLFCSTRYHP